jgi:hypothetical protein
MEGEPSQSRHPGKSRDLSAERRWKHKQDQPISAKMKGGWVYIMTNKPDGVLYIGVAADIVQRVAQRRARAGSKFCRKYNSERARPGRTLSDHR